MPLDHGQLNMPGRTGSINRDLDRYKAGAAEARRAATRQAALALAAQRAQAAALVAAMPAARIAAIAERLQISHKQAAAQLKRLAYWQPAKVLAAEQGS